MYAVADELHDIAFFEDVDDGTLSENLFSTIISEINKLSKKKIGIANIILYLEPMQLTFIRRLDLKVLKNI